MKHTNSPRGNPEGNIPIVLSKEIIEQLLIQSQRIFDTLFADQQVLTPEKVIIEIQTKIESLPPLPESIQQIENIRISELATPDDLLNIIERDPMVTANVLKIANSAAFGFSQQIKHPKNALNMLGFNMICNIAISTAMKKTIPANVDAYGLTPDALSNISSTQSALLLKWRDKKLMRHRNDLALAALLQEVGKMVISSTLREKGKQAEFKMQVLMEDEPSEVEKRFIGMVASDITALIFKHWKLNPKLVELILKSENPEGIEDETLRNQAYALKISRILFPAVVGKELSEINRSQAFALCEKGGLDAFELENVLNLIVVQKNNR